MANDIDKDVEEGKIFAFLGYWGILFLIPLLAKKENKFCQFHGKQGLVLFITFLICSIIFVIPILRWIVGFLGYTLIGILALIGMIQAITGKYWKMPILGDFAEKIKI